MNISIVGQGTIAQVLGRLAIDAGHQVEVIGRDMAKASGLAAELGGDATASAIEAGAPAGDLVILAVPYASAASVVGGYGDQLAGKVVIDVTNPFDTTTMTDLVVSSGTSGAQEIASAASPGVSVVKAFNTAFGPVIAGREVGGQPLNVFIAGDEEEAKKSVSTFVESLGMRPLDAGELKSAHWLEGMGLLIVGQAQRQANFAISFAVVG